ncbi:MAG: J domain-containing protein, partial [Chloroflexi bacterium]|nr:J domain-containing protein [Chloroflexota bacterium]
QAELRAFERRYLSIVGIRYAQLDEIEARTAEAQARLRPQDRAAQDAASHARAQDKDSAGATAEAQTGSKKFQPSDSLKKLYRETAKRFHPDTTTDPHEKARRNKLMAEINRAYSDGDEARLQEILRQWEASPDSVQGEGPGAQLVRVIRQMAQVEERLTAIESEMAELMRSELLQLKTKVEEAEGNGRDLLAEMAAQVDGKIAEARRRLADLVRQGAGYER